MRKSAVHFSETVKGSTPERGAAARESFRFSPGQGATTLGTEIAEWIRRLPKYGLTLI